MDKELDGEVVVVEGVTSWDMEQSIIRKVPISLQDLRERLDKSSALPLGRGAEQDVYELPIDVIKALGIDIIDIKGRDTDYPFVIKIPKEGISNLNFMNSLSINNMFEVYHRLRRLGIPVPSIAILVLTDGYAIIQPMVDTKAIDKISNIGKQRQILMKLKSYIKDAQELGVALDVIGLKGFFAFLRHRFDSNWIFSNLSKILTNVGIDKDGHINCFDPIAVVCDLNFGFDPDYGLHSNTRLQKVWFSMIVKIQQFVIKTLLKILDEHEKSLQFLRPTCNHSL